MIATNTRKQPATIEVTQRPLGLTVRRADGAEVSANMTRATARQLAAVLTNFADAPASGRRVSASEDRR